MPETATEPASRGMVEAEPDWVISRQRAWGVPITVFVHKETGEVIPSTTFEKSAELMERVRGHRREGRRRLVRAGAAERFLKGLVADPAQWAQVTDILDVWFNSGSTHAFTLEDPEAFPGLRRHPPCATAASTASSTWKAPTSIAAGSSRRCWKAAARGRARPSTSC